MSQSVKVLLCKAERKKIVSFNTRDDIRNIAAEAFDLPKSNLSYLVLQYFNKDFEEWVDMPSDYIPAHKEKINILLTQEVRNLGVRI